MGRFRRCARFVVLSGSLLASVLVVGCGSTLPPKELVDARAAFQSASKGPASQQTPAELHEAKQSLDQAERSFSDDGDTPATKDYAYIALRKAQLADASARTQVAEKEREKAEKDATNLTADQLRTAKSELSTTKQNLERAQEQLNDLRRIAAVKQEPRGMVITLSGAVLFASNEATLLPEAMKKKLNEVADALTKNNPDSNITVEGHTDSQGQRSYNMDLARRRADAVREQLTSHGVAPDRIKAVGVGPDRPVAPNNNAEGRANNRRVEIVVEPPKK